MKRSKIEETRKKIIQENSRDLDNVDDKFHFNEVKNIF